MGDDDLAQFNFRVDSDAKQLAKEKLDHGELSERLRQTVQELAFGEELSKRSQLETRLDRTEDRLDDLRSEKEEIEAKIDAEESKRERIEERLQELESRETEYETALEMLEDQLFDGVHLDEGHGQVQKAAYLGDKEPEDVIDDLKERNPSVPDYAFIPYNQAKRQGDTWHGIA